MQDLRRTAFILTALFSCGGAAAQTAPPASQTDATSIPLLAPHVSAQGKPAAKPPRTAAAAPVAKTIAAVAPKSAAPTKPGSALYAQYCAACHGSQREGGLAPSLVTERSRRTQDQTAALLRNPPAGMPKLFPAPLGEPEVRAITAFIRAAR